MHFLMNLKYRICKHEKYEGFQQIFCEDFNEFYLADDYYKIVEEKYIQLELNDIRLSKLGETLQMFARLRIDEGYLFIISHYSYKKDFAGRDGFIATSFLFFNIKLNHKDLMMIFNELKLNVENKKDHIELIDKVETTLNEKKQFSHYDTWNINKNPNKCFIINITKNLFYSLTIPSIIYFATSEEQPYINEHNILTYEEAEALPLFEKSKENKKIKGKNTYNKTYESKETSQENYREERELLINEIFQKIQMLTTENLISLDNYVKAFFKKEDKNENPFKSIQKNTSKYLGYTLVIIIVLTIFFIIFNLISAGSDKAVSDDKVGIETTVINYDKNFTDIKKRIEDKSYTSLNQLNEDINQLNNIREKQNLTTEELARIRKLQKTLNILVNDVNSLQAKSKDLIEFMKTCNGIKSSEKCTNGKFEKWIKQCGSFSNHSVDAIKIINLNCNKLNELKTLYHSIGLLKSEYVLIKIPLVDVKHGTTVKELVSYYNKDNILTEKQIKDATNSFVESNPKDIVRRKVRKTVDSKKSSILIGYYKKK